MTNLEATLKSVVKTLDDLRKHCSYARNRGCFCFPGGLSQTKLAYNKGTREAYLDISNKLDDLILAIIKRHPGIEE
jgi:hypothetical protein